jgi:hypothetical protein
MSYYNTTNESGKRLAELIKNAKTCERCVFNFYKNNPGLLFTPNDVWQQLGNMNRHYPLTSIRRAITNLSNDGWLIRTDYKREGLYRNKGVPVLNYCWKLKT